MEPSKEHKKLRDKIVKKDFDNFVEKLGKHDRLKCKPIPFEVDKRKLADMKPENHAQPFLCSIPPTQGL